MDVAAITIAEPDLVTLEDAKADSVTLSDRLVTIVGERPALQIDIADSGTTFAASCGGVRITGASADEATKALAPKVAAVNRAAKLQRDAKAAAAQALADAIVSVTGSEP